MNPNQEQEQKSPLEQFVRYADIMINQDHSTFFFFFSRVLI